MKTSLTARLARTLFFLIAATVAASMATVELFVDDVEDTILSLELKNDAEYFKQQLQQGQFQQWKSSRLEAIFLPDEDSESDLPGYFQNRALPFSSEVEIGETTLLVYGEETKQPPGRCQISGETFQEVDQRRSGHGAGTGYAAPVQQLP